jgi:uncharacterized membrane protein (UPF0127 family)
MSNKILFQEKCIISDLKIADMFFPRMKGLIGVKKMHMQEGMLFPRCNQIHMFFMSIPLDVLFLKKEASSLRIISIREKVVPWHFLPVMDLRASLTLEVAAGFVEHHHLQRKDLLCFG